MAKHNHYAKKLMAAKQAISYVERQNIVHRCIETIFFASAIALNQEFGFGSERIMRFKETMEKVVNEYGDLASGADTEYADGKLEEAFKKIMEG